MRPDLEAAAEQVTAARSRLAGLAPSDALVQEIEDALCVGYAHALAGDAWLTQSERRLHDLIDNDLRAVRYHELRALSGERSAMERSVATLRRELVALRREHERLQTDSRAASR